MTSELRRPARLSDVAELAGVSKATASRALNGSDRQVKQANRIKVFAAAQALGMSPHKLWARGQNRGVTLLMKGVPDDYADPIVSGVVAAAKRRGLAITMISAGSQGDDLVRTVHIARTNRAQVLIINGGRRTGDQTLPALVEAFQLYQLEGGRVVLISQAGLPFDTIAYGNREGAYDMANTLVNLGYQRFAVLAGSSDGLTQQDRSRGFLDGLRSREIEVPRSMSIQGNSEESSSLHCTPASRRHCRIPTLGCRPPKRQPARRDLMCLRM